MCYRRRACHHNDTAIWLASERCQFAFDFVDITRVDYAQLNFR
jgi:hypothetical protein